MRFSQLSDNPVVVSNNYSGYVVLHNQDWYEKQKIAGKVAHDTLQLLLKEVENKTQLTTLELSKLAEEFIIKNGCSPTFKHYKGFPEAVCISVNNCLVHGIPTNYQLQEGDIIKFDLGATFENVIADTAVTCIYGQAKNSNHLKMIEVCKAALMNAIGSLKLGERIGSIGYAIYKTAKNAGFNVIDEYGGHSISEVPHAFLFVPNKTDKDSGVRLQNGMTLAIEPLIVPYTCSTKTIVGKDNWSVYTQDINAHFEHTIICWNGQVELIT